MNMSMLMQDRRQLLVFTRLLAGYDCVGNGQDTDETALCGQCSPCEARQWLDDRALLVPSARRLPTEREREVLCDMPRAEWVRPMDVGGMDGNDVSGVLSSLVCKGYVEVKRRAGHCRPSYLYRLLGVDA